jgi:hypothetical protein
MNFTTFQKSDRPAVITAPVLTHIKTPPRAGGLVIDIGTSEAIDRGVYLSKSSEPELSGNKIQMEMDRVCFLVCFPGLIPQQHTI